MFEESIAETLDRYVDDERLKHALIGQGVIGACAGPKRSGDRVGSADAPPGRPARARAVWGYVEGGMGRVSFAIAQAALDAGAVIAAGVPVAGSCPGEGVELESGELISAPTVISNADPKRTLAMLDAARVRPSSGERLEEWRRRARRWSSSTRR